MLVPFFSCWTRPAPSDKRWYSLPGDENSQPRIFLSNIPGRSRRGEDNQLDPMKKRYGERRSSFATWSSSQTSCVTFEPPLSSAYHLQRAGSSSTSVDMTVSP